MKKLLYCFVSLFVNYFIAYIPSWQIRKMLYKVVGMKIGKHSRINMRVYIFSPWKISIGENTIVNSSAILDGRGNLTIGSNTSISMRSAIYTSSHKSWSNTFEAYNKPTIIGNGVWICINAVILAGTKLEDNVIVAANSVIKGNTERGGVYMGVPAKFDRFRNLTTELVLNNTAFFL